MCSKLLKQTAYKVHQNIMETCTVLAKKCEFRLNFPHQSHLMSSDFEMDQDIGDLPAAVLIINLFLVLRHFVHLSLIHI